MWIVVTLLLFPGGDLVVMGLTDLTKGLISMEALLVLVARPRLVRLGFDFPAPEDVEQPYEHALLTH